MRAATLLFVLLLLVHADTVLYRDGGGATAFGLALHGTTAASKEPVWLAQETSLFSVSPTSGPVGSAVRIIGSGFPSPIAALAFTCDKAPTVSAGVATVDLGTPQTSFDVEWTIPTELEPRQGEGGGPTPVGQCAFMTRPPYQGVGFVVTSAQALPSLGSGGAPAETFPAKSLIAFVVVLAFGSLLSVSYVVRARR